MRKEQKYPLMDPKIDFAFKQIFAGNNKESKMILIDLLNAILGLKGKEKIEKILYLNPYTGKKYKESKESIMDIKVKTQDQELIDIEMQIQNVDNYRKRSLYYWSQMYTTQLEEGEAYYKLKKCIVINILDFDLLKETRKYHSTFTIKEKNENFKLLDDLEIHYIELTKYPEPKNTENLTKLEEWIIFIKYAADENKRAMIEEIKKRNEVIGMAEKILNELSQDEIAREMYLQRKKWYYDRISSEKYLRHKGMEEGRKKGREEGRKEGIKEGRTQLLIKLLTKKLGELPQELGEKIIKLDDEKLDSLALNIFDIEKIEDIYKFT